jgi:hypothetical protein
MIRNVHQAFTKVVLAAALVAGVSGMARADASSMNPFIGPHSDAVKQREVQSAAVYPQQGATAGIASDKLAMLENTPPVLATTRQKLRAEEAAAVYPQQGATAGITSDKLAMLENTPPVLTTTAQKQRVVASVTEQHATP